MDENEIEMAFLEGWMTRIAGEVDEITNSKYAVTFVISRILVGGKNT